MIISVSHPVSSPQNNLQIVISHIDLNIAFPPTQIRDYNNLGFICFEGVGREVSYLIFYFVLIGISRLNRRGVVLS